MGRIGASGGNDRRVWLLLFVVALVATVVRGASCPAGARVVALAAPVDRGPALVRLHGELQQMGRLGLRIVATVAVDRPREPTVFLAHHRPGLLLSPLSTRESPMRPVAVFALVALSSLLATAEATPAPRLLALSSRAAPMSSRAARAAMAGSISPPPAVAAGVRSDSPELASVTEEGVSAAQMMSRVMRPMDDGPDSAEVASAVRAYWTWNWWQILVVVGGGAVILGGITACLWYRYRVVPRLIAAARREAYASKALSASTLAPASILPV